MNEMGVSECLGTMTGVLLYLLDLFVPNKLIYEVSHIINMILLSRQIRTLCKIRRTTYHDTWYVYGFGGPTVTPLFLV